MRQAGPRPEGPPSAFEVDSAAKKVHSQGHPPGAIAFDENALEAAIRIKKPSALHHPAPVGSTSPRRSCSRPALRGRQAVTVDDASCDQKARPLRTASAAGGGGGEDRPFDLILTGRQGPTPTPARWAWAGRSWASRPCRWRQGRDRRRQAR